MHLKADEPFSPSTMAREEMHRILSTGSVEFCGGEATQMLAYLDGLTAHEAAMAEAGMRSGPWQRLSLLFRT
ncbi:hypothetical protein [Mesorhizobium sp. LjNodule214]|uniref:hypothetical protein n=1 Tax=Mesorhizobium sp. LjNodule214 TaxID=3342252 RepID=UPI003ECF7C09